MVSWLDQYSAALLAEADAPLKGDILDRIAEILRVQSMNGTQTEDGDPGLNYLMPYFHRRMRALTAAISVSPGALRDMAVSTPDDQPGELVLAHRRRTPFTYISFEGGALQLAQGEPEVRAIFYSCAYPEIGDEVKVFPIRQPVIRVVIGRVDTAKATSLSWFTDEQGSPIEAHVLCTEDDPSSCATDVARLCNMAETTIYQVITFLATHAGTGQVRPLPRLRASERRGSTHSLGQKSLFPLMRISARNETRS